MAHITDTSDTKMCVSVVKDTYTHISRFNIKLT